jgi:hypothetical protein
MATNLTNNEDNNNNPLWVVLLVFVIWLIVFIFKLKQQM